MRYLVCSNFLTFEGISKHTHLDTEKYGSFEKLMFAVFRKMHDGRFGFLRVVALITDVLQLLL